MPTAARLLDRRIIAKPWGRRDLPPPFDSGGETIGEIAFDPPAAAPALLVKYIFTSERLSVQVHPDDAQARARGLASGKTECWYIIAADVGATLGIGLRRPVDGHTLRAAALDGSIVELMDWRPVAAGDFFHVPAGTIHAIGGGIALIEVQQNADVTYRLYDYGRPRELHLDDGIAVARPEPYAPALHRAVPPHGDVLLADDAAFAVRRVEGVEGTASLDRWVIPLAGQAASGDVVGRRGDCLFVPAGEPLSVAGGSALIATSR